MTKTSKHIEHWDRYWSYGNIHSFSQVAGGNYHGEIAGFWKQRLEALESGSLVLDIATGNGAIALLAIEESDRLERPFRVVGVDLSNIDPAGEVKDPELRAALQRVEFHGGTPAESLPIDDGVVDLACSQFGIEYSDLERAVPEVARVLKPGGRLAVIAHHRHSVVLEATRREIRQLDFVLDEVKLYLRARNLLKTMADGGREDSPKVRKKRQSLQQALERISKAAEDAGNPTMLVGPARYIREIFSATGRAKPGELLKWLDEAQARVTANRRRLRDMEEAARDEKGGRDILELLRKAGLTDLQLKPFHEADGALLGWQIEARRSA